MVQSYARLVDEYHGQGLLDKNVLRSALQIQQFQQAPIQPSTELALDIIAQVNNKLGYLICKCHKDCDVSHPAYVMCIDDAIRDTTDIWESQGRKVSEQMISLARSIVDSYVVECFHSRARRLFRTDKKYRDQLYAAMADRGLSRVQCRDKLEDAIQFIYARKDDQFEPAMLDYAAYMATI